MPSCSQLLGDLCACMMAAANTTRSGPSLHHALSLLQLGAVLTPHADPCATPAAAVQSTSSARQVEPTAQSVTSALAAPLPKLYASPSAQQATLDVTLDDSPSAQQASSSAQQATLGVTSDASPSAQQATFDATPSAKLPAHMTSTYQPQLPRLLEAMAVQWGPLLKVIMCGGLCFLLTTQAAIRQR